MFSLKITIPSLFLLFIIGSAMLSLNLSHSQSAENVKASAEQQLIRELTTLQGGVQHATLSNDAPRMVELIVETGLNPDLRGAYLIDAQEQVLASDKRENVGLSLDQLDWAKSEPTHRSELIQKSKSRFRSFIHFSEDGTSIFGVCPVQLNLKYSGIGGHQVGLILIQKDLRSVQNAAYAVVYRQALTTSAILSLLALAVGLLLHYLITIRIRLLNSAVQQWAEGSFSVSTQVKGNDEIAQLSRSFEQMVLARQKTEQALEKEKVNAQAADRAKSDFLANMSHEIRTPLNGVLGMVQLIQNTNLDEEQRNFAQIIFKSGQNLLHILSDILDFSKIEANQLVLEEVDYSLHELLENTIQLYYLPAESKSLEIGCNISSKIPEMLVGDPNRIRQVLSNLISNAVKFTERGSVYINVEIVHVGDEAISLKISVQDTGIGITEPQKDKMFHSFQQADSSTTRKYGGTGLGLAICKRLLLKMGGDIGCESQEGQGSTFWFTLRQTICRSQPAISEEFVYLRDKRILIVDDNKVNRIFLEELFAQWGILFLSVGSGSAAMRQLRDRPLSDPPFDLILLDYLMPEFDGLDVAQLVMADDELKKIPIVLLTSANHITVVEKAKKIGITCCMGKPVLQTVKLLTLMLNIILDNASTEPEATPERLEPQKTSLPSSTKSILIAEDDVHNQMVLTKMLAQLGYQSHLVENGQQALDWFEHNPVDLILMDCHMEGLDGWQTTRVLRADFGPGQSVPIIAVTADAMAGDKEKCIASGMNDYLPKPVMLDELKRVLEQWMPSS